ncbi:MAG: type II toxin-antitoxin system PemK/MazF family toxin [Candidatus Gracilibacteria bacterium]|nr:type II toxin-antitoxin system PemK/MazF family toxin [Candidatus Gracilibacteria bacterium]
MSKEYTKKVSLDIGLNEKETYVNLYQKSYDNKLHNDFIENKEDKKHNINSHTKWFNKKIKLNHLQDNIEPINKWKVCFIDYGMNIGTEINGIRPSIIFKSSSYKYGEDIIVIPMTSYTDEHFDIKSKDEFDVKIEASEKNGLDNNSLLKIRQIRCISKKRIRTNRKGDKLDIKGELDEKYPEEIEFKIKTMFGI